MTTLATFESTLRDAQATVTRTSPEGFTETLDSVIDQPAVGSTLPFDGVSLAPTDIVLDPTPKQLRAATCGVTAATLGIAEYGSLVLVSTPGGSELASLFPDRHVAVIRADDVVVDMATAFDRLGELFEAGYDDCVIATGPSATADMGELVYGAHGPREVCVILVEE